MANLKKTLGSGAQLEIQVPTFEDAHRLYKAMMEVLGGVSFNNDDLIVLISKLSTSEKVEAALWPCMARCTYNNTKITKDLFEDELIREDFLVVSKEVLTFCLRPFFKSLGSLLPKLPGLVDTDSQKQT